jgi:DNA-binding transcriptional MerR regulator
MTEPRYRLPNEVATKLQISPSTLRRWSNEFADFLSDTGGRPQGDDESKGAHRRYTDEDLETLMTVKGLLTEGLTYLQVGKRLEALRLGRPIDSAELDDGGSPVTALGPSLRVLADTLHTVADGQQLLIGGQLANRELLTVVLQDNFSLKEENAKLRDRMLELERDMVELRRVEEVRRENLEGRLRRLEEQFRPRKQPPQTQPQQQQQQRSGCLSQLFGP